MIKRIISYSIALILCFFGTGITLKAFSDAGFPETEASTPSKKVDTVVSYVQVLTNNDLKLTERPAKSVISPRGDFILVPSIDNNFLYYINTWNNSPKLENFTIPTGQKPVAVAISSNSKYAYIANEGDNTISVVRLEEEDSNIVNTITTGEKPSSIAISPDDRYLYVTNKGDDTLSIIKTSYDDCKIVNIIPVGNFPYSIKLSKTGETGYIVNQGSNDVSIIDLFDPENAQFKGSIPVGVYPSDLAISNNQDISIVSNTIENTLSVFNPLSDFPVSFGTISNVSKPAGIASDNKGNFAAVVNAGSGTLNLYSFRYAEDQSIIKLDHDDISVGGYPEFIDINSEKELMVIISPQSKTLSLIKYERKYEN
jgi:YVTN family beta-propeller protein